MKTTIIDIDEQAIIREGRRLGVTDSTRIELIREDHTDGIWTRGTHRVLLKGRNGKNVVFFGKPYHQITLNMWNQTVEGINKTLWHELAHCAQAEFFYKKERKGILKAFRGIMHWNRAYALAGGEMKASDNGAAYEGNVFEADARQVAEDNCHIKLIKICS